MDREAIAREVRRRQALEQLEFEREREGQLTEQLHELVAENAVAQVDEAAFAAMSPEDVAVVREALGEDDAGEPFEDEIGWGDDAEDEDGVDAEIARLEAALAECRSRQRAFERYLEALGES